MKSLIINALQYARRSTPVLMAAVFLILAGGPARAEGVLQANQELLKDLNPQGFFRFFGDITGLSRCSGRTSAVADYLEAFARERGLAFEKDEIGNVIIRKPAQLSQSKTVVILQAHQDMVCVKDPASAHDFSRDPIRLVRDGDWIRADGTSLGADDAMGLAAVLAVLDDQSLVHPPLEALFTVDEETNMAGVKAVRPEQLKGQVLINVDAEDLGLAYVSSAAAASYLLTAPMERHSEQAPVRWRLLVSGLKGGHSGLEINRGRANAFVVLARVLSEADRAGFRFYLTELDNGPAPGADNAIALQAEALLGFDSAPAAEDFSRWLRRQETALIREYRVADPGLKLALTRSDGPARPPLTKASRDRLLAAIRLMPLGLIRFVPDEEMAARPYGQLLVETSGNLGLVELDEAEVRLRPMTRSSSASRLAELEDRLKTLAAVVGGSLETLSVSEGWEMAAPPGRVQELFMDAGWKLVGVHGGLECGTLVGAMAKAGRRLDAISVGPDVESGHTTAERFRVSSVETFWKDLTGVLAKL